MPAKAGNLFAGSASALPGELVEVLVGNRGGIRIERIVSPPAYASPTDFWYDQNEEEWVALIQGRAALRFAQASEERVLSEGDWLMIPAHCRHRVEWTDPDRETVWLAVFFAGMDGSVPRERR